MQGIEVEMVGKSKRGGGVGDGLHPDSENETARHMLVRDIRL